MNVNFLKAFEILDLFHILSTSRNCSYGLAAQINSIKMFKIKLNWLDFGDSCVIFGAGNSTLEWFEILGPDLEKLSHP